MWSSVLPALVLVCLGAGGVAAQVTSAASDLSIPVDDGLVRAFGDNMESVREPEDVAGWDDLFVFYFPHVRRFLRAVGRAESTR